MVKVRGSKVVPLDKDISVDVDIGNDRRQFIIRVPVLISNNSILTSFSKKYNAKVSINTDAKDQLIINLKEGRKNEKRK